MESVPRRFSLRNGTLSVLDTQSFKSGLLTVTALLPITPETVCLGPLLLSVLRRGTEKYPTLSSVNHRLDDLYGTGLSIRSGYLGDRLALCLAAELLDERYLPDPVDLLAGAGELIGQILFHPLLDQSGLLKETYVESEKELQRDTIRSLRNNPRAYAAARMSRILHANEPVGIPLYGTEEQVMEVTPRQLTEFWYSFREVFCPVCFSVGSLPAARVRSVLEENLLFSGASLLPFYTAAPPLFAKEVRRVEEPMEISQGHLLFGYRAGTRAGQPGSVAAAVMTELLGGPSCSRLFQNVREKSGLCYSVGAVYHGVRGTMTVSCGLHPDNREIAEEKILAEIEAIRAEDFSDDELDVAKKSLLNGSRQTRDSAAGLEEFYRGRLLRGSSETIGGQEAKIASVTKEEVVAAARALSPDTVYFLRGTRRGGDPDGCDDEI